MWAPEPSWQPLGRHGPGSDGLWLAERDGRRWVVKRLPAAGEDEPLQRDPRHAGYWRREVEAALDPSTVDGPGLRTPDVGAVEEDDEGATLWTGEVPGLPPSVLVTARALGRYAGATRPVPAWAATDLLGDRIRLAELRDGWPTLQRTPLADVADRLWNRRGFWVERVGSSLPRGRIHGDAVPDNFPGRRGEEVVAVDWQCFGTGPVGADLGYLALSCREDFEVLLQAFCSGYAEVAGDASVEEIRTAARVTAGYTVLSRTEWVLARAARGEGALLGKLRHPAVAGHVRALERQLPQLEALL